MIERISRGEWIRNLYREACFLHLEGGRVDQALSVVSKEARKIEKPSQFHLGKSQWVEGIKLDTMKLSAGRTRQAMTITTVVFDSTNGIFRFSESIKEVRGPEKGFELEGQIDQGERIFFEEGTRGQQQMLLSKTLAAIFRIRDAEARMPKI